MKERTEVGVRTEKTVRTKVTLWKRVKTGKGISENTQSYEQLGWTYNNNSNEDTQQIKTRTRKL